MLFRTCTKSVTNPKAASTLACCTSSPCAPYNPARLRKANKSEKHFLNNLRFAYFATRRPIALLSAMMVPSSSSRIGSLPSGVSLWKENERNVWFFVENRLSFFLFPHCP